MTDKKTSPPEAPKIEIRNPENGPLIFFDSVPAFGFYNGVVHASLGSMRYFSEDGELKSFDVMAGYLRTNLPGAMALREALDKAILLAQPTEGGEN
jgi:hypothetical protein